MTGFKRFSDWAQLTIQTQHAAAITASARAKRFESRLRAFVEIEWPDVEPPTNNSLAFIPYAAKDLFVAPGRRPEGGLADILDFGLNGYADVLRRLDDAGACRVGFTAMTELAYEPSGYNAVSTYPRNPWDLDFITGGSSSGSAVAVTSGAAVIALGSDSGGSIRIPSHCTGATGWKPSWGAVSVAGALPLAPFLDCVGLLARCAADLAPAAAVLEARVAPQRAIESVVVLVDALRGAEPSIRNPCQQGIDAIQACGVAISHAEGLPAMVAIDAHAMTVMQGEAARVHAGRLDHPAISPVMRRRLAKGLTIDDATLAASRAARPQLLKDFEEQIFGKADAAILPVMAIRTPPLVEVDPASRSFSARRLYELSHYTRFVNMLGLPAVSIPVGFDDRDLPVALQIIGRPGSDFDLIALAVRVQEKTDWHGRVPTAIRDLIDDSEGLLA
ncbi:MAG: amidase [Deltaproteobacteria bacterium]|nr:amidase [Deltaproteobacteria bacterium]